MINNSIAKGAAGAVAALLLVLCGCSVRQPTAQQTTAVVAPPPTSSDAAAQTQSDAERTATVAAPAATPPAAATSNPAVASSRVPTASPAAPPPAATAKPPAAPAKPAVADAVAAQASVAATQPELPAEPARPAPAAPPSTPAVATVQSEAAPKAVKPVVPTAVASAPAAAVPSAATSSGGHRIGGTIELRAKGRQKLSPGEVRDAVIYFRPNGGSPRLQPGRHTIYTRNKAFDPLLLVVQKGSTVAFPNGDPILHNVYSNTPGQEFDFGFYGEGESKEFVFDRAGLVLVSCNVHHVMAANIMVLDTPYYTRPDASGRFELSNLPSGLGELVIWHPRGSAETQPVALPTSGDLRQVVDINRPRLGVARR